MKRIAAAAVLLAGAESAAFGVGRAADATDSASMIVVYGAVRLATGRLATGRQ